MTKIMYSGFILAVLSMCLVLSISCKPPEKEVKEERLYSLEKSPQTFDPVWTFQPGLGDLDNDGDLDVFVANFRTSSNEIWFNSYFKK